MWHEVPFGFAQDDRVGAVWVDAFAGIINLVFGNNVGWKPTLQTMPAGCQRYKLCRLEVDIMETGMVCVWDERYCFCWVSGSLALAAFVVVRLGDWELYLWRHEVLRLRYASFRMTEGGLFVLLLNLIDICCWDG